MVYIIRHGKTEMNKANLIQGRSDILLNAEGIEQGKTASEKLKNIEFSYVFTSPLSRAVQTAKIIVPSVAPIKDERLIEMDYGIYEGADLNKPDRELIRFFSDFINEPAPESMEELSSVVARVGNFLEEIKELKGNVLISTHAIAMKGALEYLSPDSNGGYWSKYIGNCAIYKVPNENGKYGIPKEVI